MIKTLTQFIPSLLDYKWSTQIQRLPCLYASACFPTGTARKIIRKIIFAYERRRKRTQIHPNWLSVICKQPILVNKPTMQSCIAPNLYNQFNEGRQANKIAGWRGVD